MAGSSFGQVFLPEDQNLELPFVYEAYTWTVRHQMGSASVSATFKSNITLTIITNLNWKL